MQKEKDEFNLYRYRSSSKAEREKRDFDQTVDLIDQDRRNRSLESPLRNKKGKRSKLASVRESRSEVNDEDLWDSPGRQRLRMS